MRPHPPPVHTDTMTVAVQGTRDIPITHLTRYPGNPRRGNIPEIRSSVRRLGQYRTIVVRDTGDALVILAAHRTQRRAYAMEIDPAYCDVICQRYADHTGTRPELIRSQSSHA